MEVSKDCDVVVVGGGLAGICCALRLAELQQKVILLDAKQLGGRTKSILMKNSIDKVSVGGTWANFECDDLLGLAYEADCLPFAPPLEADGKALPHMLKHPVTLLYMFHKGKKYAGQLRALKKGTVRVLNSKAKALDNCSIGQWLRDHKLNEESALVWLSQLENLPWDLEEISALYAVVLVYIRLRAPSDTGKIIPRTFRWEGGTGALVQALKTKLEILGVEILEDHPVWNVVYNGNSVTIQTKGKKDIIRGKKAVFAISPWAISKQEINFKRNGDEHNAESDPSDDHSGEGGLPDKHIGVCELPAEYIGLNNAMKAWSDPAYNIVLTFKTAFWNSGNKYKNYLPSPLKRNNPHKLVEKKDRCFGAVMDLTPASSSKGYIRILVDPVRVANLSEDEVKKSALAYLEKCYSGLKWEKKECDVTIEDWRKMKDYLDVTYYWPPDGSYSKYFEFLAKPYESLYWAGAERSLSGVSWMEGAVSSGTEAARQITQDLPDAGDYFKNVKQTKKDAVALVRKRSNIITDEVNTIAMMIKKSGPDLDKFEAIFRSKLVSGKRVVLSLFNPYAINSSAENIGVIPELPPDYFHGSLRGTTTSLSGAEVVIEEVRSGSLYVMISVDYYIWNKLGLQVGDATDLVVKSPYGWDVDLVWKADVIDGFPPDSTPINLNDEPTPEVKVELERIKQRITELRKAEKQKPIVDHYDVVVVGAGLSGLTAAFRLAELGQRVAIVDAWEVGGRAKSITMLNGDKISVGDTWVSLACDDVLGLASEVNTLPYTPNVALDGDGLPQMLKDPFSLLYMYHKGRKYTDQLLTGHLSDSAKKLDRTGLKKWLDERNLPKSSRHSVLVWFSQENLPWDLEKISALFACVLVFNRLYAPSHTGTLIPYSLRWEGGTGVFVQALKEKLHELGVRIFEDHPVSVVKYSDHEVTLEFKDQEKELKAQKAVLAISPPATRFITFYPSLPSEYAELTEAMHSWPDAAYNVVLAFDSPFWQEDNKQRIYIPNPLSRYSDKKPTSVFGLIMDLSPNASEKGYLRISVHPGLVQDLTVEEVKIEALTYLERCYPGVGWDKNPCTLYVENWIEKQPYLDVKCFWPPNGSFSEGFSTLTKPHKSLYWAGAERSISNGSSMECAVTSGTFVARQIAQEMNLHADEYFKRVSEIKESVRGRMSLLIPTIAMMAGNLQGTTDPLKKKISAIFSEKFFYPKIEKMERSLESSQPSELLGFWEHLVANKKDFKTQMSELNSRQTLKDKLWKLYQEPPDFSNFGKILTLINKQSEDLRSELSELYCSLPLPREVPDSGYEVPAVVVLGQTQSGKTTLVNSIRKYSGFDGPDLFVGDGNLSATTKTTVVSVADFDIPSYINLPGSLEEFLTEDWKRPQDALERKSISGFRLIDASGLGDNEGRDSRHILGLARAIRDAGSLSGAILVVNSDQPLDENMKEGLEYYLRFLDSFQLPLFVVHTKWDAVAKPPEDKEHRKEVVQQFLNGISGKEVECIHFFIDLCGWEDNVMKRPFTEHYEALKSNSLHSLCKHIAAHTSSLTHEFMIEKPKLFKTVDSQLMEIIKNIPKQMEDMSEIYACDLQGSFDAEEHKRLYKESLRLNIGDIIDFKTIEPNLNEDEICHPPATSYKFVDIPCRFYLEDIVTTSKGVIKAKIVWKDPTASEKWDSVYFKDALIATGPSSVLYETRIEELRENMQSLSRKIQDLENTRRGHVSALPTLDFKTQNTLDHFKRMGWLSSFLSRPKLSIPEYVTFLSRYEDYETEKEHFHKHPEKFADSIFTRIQLSSPLPSALVTPETPITKESVASDLQLREIFDEITVRGRFLGGPVTICVAPKAVLADEKSSSVLQDWILLMKSERDPDNIYSLGLEDDAGVSQIVSRIGRLNPKGKEAYSNGVSRIVGVFLNNISLELLCVVSNEVVGSSQHWVTEIIPRLEKAGMHSSTTDLQKVCDLEYQPFKANLLAKQFFYLKIGNKHYLNLDEEGRAYWGEKKENTPYFRKVQLKNEEKTEGLFFLQIMGPVFQSKFLTSGFMNFRLVVTSEKEVPSFAFVREPNDARLYCFYFWHDRSPVCQRFGTHSLYSSDLNGGNEVAVQEEPWNSP